MKRFIVAGLLTALVLFPMFGYVYMRGAADGISRYRDSNQFKMTLFSMYAFGVQDGCTNPTLCVSLPK
jgi:hypothetical protein